MQISPFLKSKPVKIGILLAMADSATTTISSIYAYSIFLSFYPPQWLIYFIVLKSFFSAFMRSVGLFFLPEDIKKGALIQFAIFIIILMSCVLLKPLHSYFLIFVISIIVASLPELSTVICWNLLSLSFGIREYKAFVSYGNQATFVGIIISSFLVPLIVSFFYNTALIFFTMCLLALCAVLIYQLPIQKQEKKPVDQQNKMSRKPSQYRLYYHMLFFSIIVATIITVSQYFMRIEVSVFYTNERLSAFFGYFSGLTCIIGFVVAAATQQIIRRLGLEALLYATPVVSLFFASFVIISPGLWSTVLLAGSQVIFTLSLNTYATEVILNILPPSVRVLAKSNIKSTSKIISVLFLLFFTIEATNIVFLAYCLIIPCFIAIYITYKIRESYKSTLQAESSFKRYNILDEINNSTAPVFKEIAINSIKSKDVYSVCYGIDLLYRLHLNELPRAFYSLLHNCDLKLKNATIDLIIQEKNTKALPFLIKQLSIEQDRPLRFKLFETIVRMQFNKGLKIPHSLPEKIFKIVLTEIDLYHKEPHQYLPLLRLMRFVDDPEVLVRKMMASLIGTFKIMTFSEYLAHLIHDNNTEVSDEALRSAASNKMLDLLPEITKQLVKRKGSYVPFLTIVSLGSATLPYLLSNIFKNKTCGTYIRTIAAIKGSEAEQALIDIINQGNVLMRSLVAQYLNERACKMGLNNDIKIKAKCYAREECLIVFQLNKKLQEPLIKPVRVEVLLRIELAKKRFLQWLAISTESKQVNRLMTSLLEANKSATPIIFDKAIELLELYIGDKKTHDEISYIFENKMLDFTSIAPYPYQDTWLEKIMENPMSEANQKYPFLSIIFELRAVPLFKELPAEVLMAIAEEIEYRAFNPQEYIFTENDAADGLYCVSQGVVEIIRGETHLATIEQHGFFGELALLDEEKRLASAIAKTECSLIFIEKDLFNRISNDVPDVLRAVLKVILGYLRKNLSIHQ